MDDGTPKQRDGEASGRPAANDDGDDDVESYVDESDETDGLSKIHRVRNLAEFGMRCRVFGHALFVATDTPSPMGGKVDSAEDSDLSSERRERPRGMGPTSSPASF